MGRRPKRIDLPADVPSPEPVTRRSRRRGKAETERLKERPISPTEMEVGEEDTFALPGQQITRLVLETVAQMPPPGVGLRTIAGILRGETRANWLSYIARTENWGALFPNSLASVEALLQDLVRAGYIEGKHFVRLTEKGQRALEDANELPVPRRPLKAVPPSLRPLLWKLLLLRARLVNERKAPGLLKDSVLLQLLQHPPKRLSELKKMKGVGAFIANNLGKEIVRVVREFFQRSEASKKEAPSDGAA